MSMFISWEYYFPAMIFWDDRVCKKDERGRCIGNIDGWNPEEDFRAYLENLKVDKKWFEGDTEWKAKRFEEARSEMLARVEINRIDDFEYDKDEWDDDYEEDYIVCFKVFNISLKDTGCFDHKVLLSNGEEHSVYGEINNVIVYKINPIFLLLHWLCSVLPYGARANDFYIGAYGISEYDETYTESYLYIQDRQAKLHLQSTSIRKREPSDDDPFMDRIIPTHETEERLRSLIGGMHPSGEVPEWSPVWEGAEVAGDDGSIPKIDHIPEFGGSSADTGEAD